MSEADDQEFIHQAITDILGDGEILTGWIVSYEGIEANGDPFAGHIYGPEAMTTWRALGLLEWARGHTLTPEPADE